MRSANIIVILVLALTVCNGCSSGSGGSGRVKKLSSGGSGTRQETPKQYDYQHSIQKGDIKESSIGEGRSPLKHRIAVARFGDLKQPWRSPFFTLPVTISAEDTTSVQADKNGIVLEQKEKAQLGTETEPCPAFTGLLIDRLMADGRFIVVERKEINKLLLEQEFGASGHVRSQTAAELRHVQGVSLLITGEVTTVPAQTEGHAEETLALLRIYDVETAEVLASIGVQAPELHRAVEQAAEKIADRVEEIPWRVKISKVKTANTVYLNCGSRDGVQELDRFMITAVGDDIIDPDEGTVLGSQTQPIGVVEVTQVEEKFCVARTLIKRNTPYRRKDLAEYIPGPYGNDLIDYKEMLKMPSDDQTDMSQSMMRLTLKRYDRTNSPARPTSLSGLQA